MQPMDPADPRKPNVQIAASIGQPSSTASLSPGAQLPAVAELAKFFGVSA